jgi:hypothetical protein
MKKANWKGTLVMALVFAMTVVGCVITPVSTRLQDTSIPWQEHAMLYTFHTPYVEGAQQRVIMSIIGLDDKVGETVQDPIQIGLIPPGTHTITCKLQIGDTYAKATVTREFQPGGRYVVYGWFTDTRYMLAKAEAHIDTLEEFELVYEKSFPKGKDVEGYSFEEQVVSRFDKAAEEFGNMTK